MKNLLVIAALMTVGTIAQANTYNCALSNGQPNDPAQKSFSLDTDREENKFIDLGQGVSVGCLVFRSQTQLISCGMGDEKNFSTFVTAENGSSLISLDTNSSGTKVVLRCIKAH